jgi:hypothetical protein
MRPRSRFMRHVGCGLWAAAFLAAGATSASAQALAKGKKKGNYVPGKGPSGWVNPLANRYIEGPPLQVCDEGAFFVGGVPKVTTFAGSAVTEGVAQQIIIGQAYVQFQIPKKALRRWCK